MSQQNINIGAVANDGTGDPLRTAGQKINANFSELYSSTSTLTSGLSSANSTIAQVSASAASHSTDADKHAHGAGFTIDGQGSVITTGIAGEVAIPVSGTITGAWLVSDQTGSIVLDLWKQSSGSFPTSVNTICGTAKPTLASARAWSDTSLTSWSRSVSVGDIIVVNVVSVTSVTRVTLTLRIV